MTRTPLLKTVSVLGTVVLGGAAFAFWSMPVPLPAVRTPPAKPQAAGPVRIPDAQFGPLIERLSEPEGYFDTDNFISNETSYQHVVGRLRDSVAPGGAYVGVGPDQNFTYIVHARPSVAIVVDIRRQNMLQHLLLKVLIQESADRADFVCALFARKCSGARWTEDADLETLLEGITALEADPAVVEGTLARVLSTLGETYRVDLSAEDRERIEYVYRSFARAGPSLRFSSFGGNNVVYPTYTELMIETDGSGRRAGHLASEALFDRLREFQEANLLVPVVGDFAGSRSLGAVAEYLRETGVGVSVFYTSNVEYYLFGTPDWNAWVRNVGAFTFTDDAVFLRAYFPTYGRPHPENVAGYRPTSLIQSVSGFLDDAGAGGHRSYWDVVIAHRR